MSLEVTEIPDIMDAKGWSVAPRLMKHWFSLPANQAKNGRFQNHNSEIVTMKWLLKFTRANDIYQTIFRERIWANDAAKKQIANVFRRNIRMCSDAITFDYFTKASIIEHKNYVNYRAYTEYGWFDDLDDLFGALGRFALYVTIGGKAEYISGPGGSAVGTVYALKISHVGVYLRDQYDFNGDQPLGWWKKPDQIRKTAFQGATSIDNASFRAWRNAKSRGGDFAVFSDCKVVPLSAKDELEISL